MTTANDNAPPLPTPAEFSTLLGELVGEVLLLEQDYSGAHDVQALRMRIIEAYERAYGARELKGGNDHGT